MFVGSQAAGNTDHQRRIFEIQCSIWIPRE